MLRVHAYIEVSDLERGIEFYCSGLNLALERSYQRHWTPVHLDFIVADLDRALAKLKMLGAVLERPIKDREYGRIANLSDPFGNGLDIIQFNEEGYDAVDKRE